MQMMILFVLQLLLFWRPCVRRVVVSQEVSTLTQCEETGQHYYEVEMWKATAKKY